MKKLSFLLAFFILSATVSFAQQPGKFIAVDAVVGNRQPTPDEARLMHGEEARHPNITKSMHDIEDAMKHLNEAPDDFGGHKAQALADLKQSWISLRKALYYRIYQDMR